MSGGADMAARFGLTRAREAAAEWHASMAAEVKRALAAKGVGDCDRAFLAAQWEFHDQRAAGYRKAMEEGR